MSAQQKEQPQRKAKPRRIRVFSVDDSAVQFVGNVVSDNRIEIGDYEGAPLVLNAAKARALANWLIRASESLVEDEIDEEVV